MAGFILFTKASAHLLAGIYISLSLNQIRVNENPLATLTTGLVSGLTTRDHFAMEPELLLLARVANYSEEPSIQTESRKVNGDQTSSTLKFIVPHKAGSSEDDAVWVYGLSYGGGIVSGDTISCKFEVGDGCTLVLTTQASTKVSGFLRFLSGSRMPCSIHLSNACLCFLSDYKSLRMKCSRQLLEAEVGSGSVFVVIPDPVTCFSTARLDHE
ncbi:hypothetical protein MLD38_015731 [Melastoma candidum]|uniref:Uncharacterized protein n=1 Tax=Melastoma candidum TaxID=119954 RepID=A0ACB9RGR1_9MYRT|nr:hypothetical protein MLD38_015731 [Melastoma candidum]